MVCLRQLESVLLRSSCSQQQVEVPQSRPSQNQLSVEASEGTLANNASKNATTTRPDKSFRIYFSNQYIGKSAGKFLADRRI